MVVCIEPTLGLFFRINTDDKWQTPVKLTKADNPFLEHDSFLECGEPLELDEYCVEESIQEKGIIGRISPTVCPSIMAAVEKAKSIRAADKVAIRKALGLD